MCFQRLSRGLDLGQSLALFEAALLLEAHNLEAVEVGQVLSPLDLVALLGPAGLSPLAVDLGLLPELAESSLAGAARKVLNDEAGEKALLERDGLPGDGELGVGGDALDKDLYPY
jgi:hypothetical protein